MPRLAMGVYGSLERIENPGLGFFGGDPLEP